MDGGEQAAPPSGRRPRALRLSGAEAAGDCADERRNPKRIRIEVAGPCTMRSDLDPAVLKNFKADGFAPIGDKE
ncbi:hypothetical protein GR328_02065 [Microvirga makkahensis]|uniref:Uncharacterized protein n=1 Tax=Microvirga makkahensis TaxID=1128670 RepID=A0A7X3MNQ2_9HYPH|nr:hypothetical protein [Microvirga makkahensis]